MSFKKHLLKQAFCGSDSGLCAGVLCLVVVGSALVGVEGLLLAEGGLCLEGGEL